jgi:hypothetical protein
MKALKLISAEPQPNDAAPPAPDADTLAELIAERGRISAEIGRLSVATSRRAEAEGRLGAIDARLRALDDAESTLWRTWAEAGVGEEPTPRREERRDLIQKRHDGETELDAAKVAESAVAPRLNALMGELRLCEARRRAIRLARVLEAGAGLHAEGLRLARASAEPLQKLRGLRDALIQQASSAAARSDGDGEREFLAAVEQLDKLKVPIVLADQAVVARHATEWRRILE